MRLRAVAHEQVVVVRLRASIESNVSAIVASAANGRVVVTKMAAAHVVVRRIDESVFGAIERLSQIRIEEVPPRVRHQRLRAKRRLLVDAQPRIESSQL